ncbi:MAG: hypothetical protein JXR97_12330 [Planctomycetes bacterium]|nr:hypothetical protein [Planctomycetota bacterium]
MTVNAETEYQVSAKPRWRRADLMEQITLRPEQFCFLTGIPRGSLNKMGKHENFGFVYRPAFRNPANGCAFFLQIQVYLHTAIGFGLDAEVARIKFEAEKARLSSMTGESNLESFTLPRRGRPRKETK